VICIVRRRALRRTVNCKSSTWMQASASAAGRIRVVVGWSF